VEHLDVLVVGAGISGIAAGYHLQTDCPDLSYAILERRDRLGGTWDLFRYPGIRSDSDMFTLGFPFRPWPHAKGIADGPAILAYLQDTAREFGIDRKMRFGRTVTRAAWSSDDARWTVDVVRADGTPERIVCRFLMMCSGYYDYDAGYTPEFPGRDAFRGTIVHPQHWPEDLDWTGKRVVVIGSGATAVTLIPSLTPKAAHVTMLQRSPTWIVALPGTDPLLRLAQRVLPERVVGRLGRWKSIVLSALFFQFCRRFPARARAMLLAGVRQELGPDYDVATHFTPRYDPWDQRVCLAPNGDFWEAIRSGRASVVTDHVARFTERGILLASGRELEADVIVTATGLVMKMAGGVQLGVDGQPTDLAHSFTYKGVMFTDVPNLAMAIGYTNASWTLKCDLTCAWVCRLLNHMADHDVDEVRPRRPRDAEARSPLLELSSGYILRAADRLPKQATTTPWRAFNNYLLDLWTVGWSRLDDGVLQFRRARGRGTAADEPGRAVA
jgi:cation diffusion facilitator CzcD-associated flavoprotein CzcO